MPAVDPAPSSGIAEQPLPTGCITSDDIESDVEGAAALVVVVFSVAVSSSLEHAAAPMASTPQARTAATTRRGLFIVHPSLGFRLFVT
jgi:hypothetical protein